MMDDFMNPEPSPLPLEEPVPQEAAKAEYKLGDTVVDDHPELVNLARYLPEKTLQEIGDQVRDEYDVDEKTREEWLDMQAEWVELYNGGMKSINPPWEGASEDHVPCLTEGVIQFHARAFKAFFASKQFVSCVPTARATREDLERADRIAKYMSWQLGVKDKHFRRNKDRLLKALPLFGSYMTKTYRDNVNSRVVVENVSPLDLVVNYSNVGVDIEDLDRKTQVIELPRRLCKFYASEKAGKYFTHIPEESTGGATNVAKEAAREAMGIQPSQELTNKGPAVILEQHRWLDLDEDGVEEPYIVWIDKSTGKVLRVAIRWSWDSWVQTNFKKPLEYYTHYVYLENPDGFYGIGQGGTVGPLNIAIDKLLRQIVNAGTLQNTRPGFASGQAGLPSGTIPIQPGKITKLNASGKINDYLMFLDHPGPSEALFKIVQMLVTRADRLNMVTEMLTGQYEKVWQTGATNSLIDQGLQVFSAVQTRVWYSLGDELQKIFRLNGIYMSDAEYFAFHDGQTIQQMEVWKGDFQDDLQVSPTYDPRESNEQEKLKKSQMEYQICTTNPLIAQNPQALAEATRRILEALGSPDVEELLPMLTQEGQQAQQGQAGQDPRMEMQKQAMQGQMAVAMGQQKNDQARLQLDAQQAKTDAMLKSRELDIKENDSKLKAMTTVQKAQADERKAQMDMQARQQEQQARSAEQQQRMAMQAQQAAVNQSAPPVSNGGMPEQGL
jgi:hypothetical protein